MAAPLMMLHGAPMAQVLEPVRQVRPVNGGPGFTQELIEYLRGLNYDLSGNSEEAAEEDGTAAAAA